MKSRTLTCITAMRYLVFVLAGLIAIGCGTRSGNRDPLKFSAFSPPFIAALIPESVPVNSVPFTVTVNGSNFGADAVVFWNSTPMSTTFVTSNQLMAAVTDTDLMFAGLARVFVRTGGLNSNTVDFNVSVQ